MSLHYTKKQEKWIKYILANPSSNFKLFDILEHSWPIGQLEISTFQQKLLIYLDTAEEAKIDEIVIYLMEVSDLIHSLIRDGFVYTWDEIPMEDNNLVIGHKKESSLPKYLPDLSVATTLLKLAGKKYKIKENLHVFVEHNFRDQSVQIALSNQRILLASFTLMIALMIGGGFFIRNKFSEKINDLESELVIDQMSHQKQLDRLDSGFRRLYELTYEITSNKAEKEALETVKDAVQRSHAYTKVSISKLLQSLDLNSEALKVNDSLLNVLVDEKYDHSGI